VSIVEKAMEKLERASEASAPATPGPAGVPPGEREEGAAAVVTALARARVVDAGDIVAQRSRVPSARRGLASVAPAIHIDAPRLRSLGLMPPEDAALRMADEYRRIKRPLLAGAFGKGAARLPHGNLLMVGSSMPGEGKTFTSLNLALSIVQELDYTVLLVDADVAKPHITRVLELEGKPGLIDVLVDDTLDLQDVLVSTDIEGLRVLPAGPVHRQSTELLASERMAALVSEMADRYPDRVLVFDTPPLLATTEAQVMSSLMGQVLLVVRAGITPQQAVMQSLETLGPRAGVNIVLNQVRGAWSDEYYGYGYGYN
jgi:protein-tyrosine kinase